MDGFRACKLYLATKFHFEQEKYDVFENSGSTKYSYESYLKRRDKTIFERLAVKFKTERDLVQFYVANFAYCNPNGIYDGEAFEYYTTWLKRKEAMTQVFRNDLSTITTAIENKKLSFTAIFDIELGDPELLKLYLGGHITLETMVIIQEFEDYLTRWQSMTMLWHHYFKPIQKVRRFIKFNRERCGIIYHDFKNNLLDN